MEWGTILSWIGGVTSTVIILALKAHLERRTEDRRTRIIFVPLNFSALCRDWLRVLPMLRLIRPFR